MDTLHGIMRNLQGEQKAESRKPAEHVTVFREFVARLDRMSRVAQRTPPSKAPRPVRRKAKR